MNELAQRYRDATVAFLEIVHSLSERDLDKSYKKAWTPRQVIHHMADSEAQSYARLRRLIAEPGTVIQGYDESIWAESEILGYKSESIESAVAVITAVRNSSFQLLARLPASLLDNAGIHSESGTYTVRTWIETYTQHPIEHASQIKKQISL